MRCLGVWSQTSASSLSSTSILRPIERKGRSYDACRGSDPDSIAQEVCPISHRKRRAPRPTRATFPTEPHLVLGPTPRASWLPHSCPAT